MNNTVGFILAADIVRNRIAPVMFDVRLFGMTLLRSHPFGIQGQLSATTVS